MTVETNIDQVIVEMIIEQLTVETNIEQPTVEMIIDQVIVEMTTEQLTVEMIIDQLIVGTNIGLVIVEMIIDLVTTKMIIDPVNVAIGLSEEGMEVVAIEKKGNGDSTKLFLIHLFLNTSYFEVNRRDYVMNSLRRVTFK
ncbi:hypothetical protein ENU1_133710 [Entamoeba nuttalli P19]|uniref:Uncharacterized protein n=1 Tax=Entamoeba nuttalli (strain P19) TaxID=1076696 RepID=K2H9N3_ENTNP|nr:hypothetical protein ENU1_133710 [Entamoeba nuttalli P19]EKE39309.1 hypothetical protein ENU1_133710 [Entamoeba nuttalli P19]|eukprot:XP_008858354.1 hypothetical protein ENU1_133710 [Entamoeba nuttalli P19]